MAKNNVMGGREKHNSNFAKIKYILDDLSWKNNNCLLDRFKVTTSEDLIELIALIHDEIQKSELP